ncbi:MAG: Ppx/GppA family phosphatase [Acidobacteria bacterium]|nr:Ppx/GppA family phosphatase [Acidobacteriota bacterium]
MLAAEINAGRPPEILASDREVTRLGASVFRDGRISRDAMDLVCGVLARMAKAYQGLNVMAVRAVATSATRDASNRHDFLERASKVIGSPVEVISGTEEARLIHLGVQSRWPHPRQSILILDVGGGSAELIHGRNGAMVEGISRPLGAVRLTEVFLDNDPPTEAELHRLEEFIDDRLAVPVKKIGRRRFDRVIATSATAAALVCSINRVPRSKREEADRVRASASQLRKLYRELSRRDLESRRKVRGIGPRRAEIVVAGAAVFARVLDALQIPALYYSVAGLRDGILADLALRGAGRERSRLTSDQLRTVLDMARRYGVSLAHVRAVAGLAHDLFVGLQPVHELPAEDGRLLEAAAYLHDIGHYVSDTGHHKHSAYLVWNSDLPGFTDRERAAVAQLCRYHRKALPSQRHGDFQDLPSEERRKVVLLAPLLRMADALDRSHEQRVSGVECIQNNGSMRVNLRARGDIALELWAAERAGELFRATYDVPLSFGRMRQAA